MNGTTRGLLTIAIAPLLLIGACAGDDQEYNDFDQPIEKTNVRVAGVGFGRAVDGGDRIIDTTDVFGPNDTIYASVRTKGASPKTILGVRWKNPAGEEIGMNNVVIRPTGDTSTLFVYRDIANRGPGSYSLDLRVNGKTVKTVDFSVGTETETRRAASSEPVDEPGADKPKAAPGGVRPFLSRTYRRLTGAVASLSDRASGDQSPFEWKGLRAGMQFSRLNRLTEPGTPWQCTPFFLSGVGVQRNVALESPDFSAGHVTALVDTIGHHVFSLSYYVSWMPPDTTGRVAFERELTALATKWDDMPGLISKPAREVESGPSSATWVTPDSAWSARISYTTSHGRTRPDGFEIEEIQWGHRLEAEIPDSIKGQMHNPESAYYRNQTPRGGCDALLKSP